MNKPKFSIRDKLFSHAFSSSNWYKPTFFDWDFNNLEGDFVFFTDSNVYEVQNSNFDKFKKYAWLVESPQVTPNSYKFVEDNFQLFDKIFTHSEKILNKPNSYLLPIGGCHLDEDEINLNYQKTKVISMVYSHKNYLQGHNLRHEIANKFGEYLDIMGSGKTGIHTKKIESCRDYAFSVVIENCSEGFYFTEKIIDCFLSGVIPIYWGSPNIDKFFNIDGFFTFNDLNSLNNIIKDHKALMDFYYLKEKEIKDNYQRALQYKIGEDYLYTKYKKIL